MKNVLMMRIVLALCSIGMIPFGEVLSGQASEKGTAAKVLKGPESESFVLQTSSLQKAGSKIKAITLSVRDSSLSYVLQTISKQASYPIVFDYSDPLFDKKITINLRETELLQAVKRAISGTGLSSVIAPDGNTLVIRRSASSDTGQVGQRVSLRGKIYDSATKEGLEGAVVSVSGTSVSTISKSDGSFVLVGVIPGERVLSAKLLGYKSTEIKVSVKTSTNSDIAISISASVKSLNEVVTTATGQQRRVEVANDIVKINVEEIAARSPVRTVADILEASQVPGVQVQRGGGDPGAPTKIRIRGVSSISQSNDPVVILDGIWIDGATSKPSKLDEIDPATIDKIEIVRGPSAATLYGQDASNGIIVITTKRGIPGTSRWDVSYSRDWGQTYGTLPISHVGIGYDPIVRAWMPCPVSRVLLNQCVQETVVVNDPNDPIFGSEGTETKNRYSLRLDGGSNSVTYSLTGSQNNTIGVRRTSPLDLARFRRVGYAINDRFSRPSKLSRNNLSSTLNLRPMERLTIGITATTSQSRLTDNRLETNWEVLLNGRIPLNTIGVGPYGSLDTLLNPDPSAISTLTTRENPIVTSNNILGTSIQYGPFNTRGLRSITIGSELGIERGSTETSEYLANIKCGVVIVCYDSLGARDEESKYQELYTARIRASSELSLGALGRFLEIRPSVGADLKKNNIRTVELSKKDIPAGDRSINGGTLNRGSRNNLENATAGWYVNSNIGILRRIYFDMGVRQDIGSAITSSANYPKLGGSWLVSDESFWKENSFINLLRIRSSFGHSAVQPELFDIYGQYLAGQALVDGKLVRSVRLSGAGNSMLQPERAVEIEVGFDADLLHDRINLIVTYASSQNKNALISRTLPPSLISDGGVRRKENIGRVANRNMEISSTVRVLENRTSLFILNYGLTLSDNKIKELGDELTPTTDYVEGYPLTSAWRKAVLGYRDNNGDGLLSRNEVILSTNPVYIGSTQPKYSASYGGSLTLFGNVTFDSRFSYESQYVQTLRITDFRYASEDISAPLDDQAQEFIDNEFGNGGNRTRSVSHLRWNSASIQYHIPKNLLQLLRSRSVSVSLLAQNMMMWSNYAGRDPGVNSDLLRSEGRSDDSRTPPSPRLFVLDFKVGF